MNKWIWIPAAAAVLAAAVLVLVNHLRTRKTIDTIEQMLRAATEDDFSEKTFDESRLSALETKFAHYLSASAVSARNVTIEKDKIKTLIADISHQSKTPLANLLLYCELLEEEELSETARSYAQALAFQTKKLHFLIDSLVKLSRLENGIVTLSPREESLQPTLQKVQEQLETKAAGKGLKLCLQETSVSAKFDPKWTEEALCNIVDNAIKYTGQGSVTISVIAYEMFARIDIADTGIGIPEEEQAKIFSRFYRAESTREHEGVGIGLYLAREIISGEGGYIKVTSACGRGSVFSVFLPK